MNRQGRYEAVPQRDQEVIILDSIASPAYNYNSGIPTGTSTSTPSIASTSTSIPNSPPPSFHTTSSPGTPRPSHAQLHNQYHPQAELWGIAPSTVGGETLDGGVGSSNDALATIKGLKQRVEWLEESIGRLLLEKEERSSSTTEDEHKRERNNCCVTFSDMSPDLERALMTTSRGQNCCVAFSGSRPEDAVRKDRKILLAVFCFVVFAVCATISLVAATKNMGANRG